MMAFYYILRERSPRQAWEAMLGGALLGLVFGFTQVVRGAHFPSHVAVTASVVWILCTALYWIPFRGTLAVNQPRDEAA